MLENIQVNWLWVPHHVDKGDRQMALDEALLTWVQDEAPPLTLIVRTYQWSTPTLSLGVHQNDASVSQAYRIYSDGKVIDMVRRPTGGRAILHGNDVSFAFVTNVPGLLKASLNDSYCYFTRWVKQALIDVGVPLQTACDGSNRDYVRSALCFETKMPTDLVAETGEKVAGSAQLRRQGGLLQHGAAFLAPFGITPGAFDAALQATITTAFGCQPELLHPEADNVINTHWQMLETRYREDAEQTLARLATTSGSHLLPASD